jgi:hypothetical protein
MDPWAGLVEVREVDAEVSSSHWLGHNDRVGQPLGVSDELDELGLLKLLHLLDDELLLLRRLTPHLLFHRARSREHC